MGTDHIPVNDGRFHAAGAIALYPAETGEGETLQLLTKIFHHVVAFSLAVYQHVQSQRLLPGYGVGNGVADALLRLLSAAMPRCVVPPVLADGSGPGERAESGGGKQRPAEPFLMQPDRPPKR